MLSILIPVYNFNVTQLVNDLHKQVLKQQINFEILLYDDCSSIYKDKNKQLSYLQGIKYYELSENIGRSKIRNLLAKKAKYNNLLFLDCDSGISKDNYIIQYLKNTNNKVVYGGTEYTKEPPKEKSYYLRWHYGIKREALPLKKRRKKQHISFKTNNFLIKKEIFNKIKFNENLKGYGHEDTFFSLNLQNKKIEIKHIDNPVIHLGLEKNKEFIDKTKAGILNLVKILKKYPEKKDYFIQIKLVKYFYKVKKLYFCGLLKMILKVFNKFIINNLTGKRPNLYYFDIWKLAFLCKEYS